MTETKANTVRSLLAVLALGTGLLPAGCDESQADNGPLSEVARHYGAPCDPALDHDTACGDYCLLHK